MSDLLSLAARLVDVPSVSRNERAIADMIEWELRHSAHLELTRVGDNVVARTLAGHRQRLVLAGHLDTVPPAGNERASVEGGVLSGLGSTDMKGGVAVLLDLARRARETALDVTYVFYSREEVARSESGLLEIERRRPELLWGDAAVLAEPTAGHVEAGCQGVLRVSVRLGGRRAHVARPWVGLNAIHRLGAVLSRVAGHEGRRPVIDGCEYRESLQAVAVSGGAAANVVPDEASVSLSHRFAPDRDGDSALSSLEELLAPAMDAALGDRVVVEDLAPAAPPGLDAPLLAALVGATGRPAKAKLGWTDVAFFAGRGIPAANFGPGDPLLAHTPEERVSAGELEQARSVLASLLGAGDRLDV